MLATRQKVLRNFWYATLATDALAQGPKPFRLLGQDIVLFLDAEGRPAALEDRCCHRTAKLSKGWIKGGNIVCGYHGWEYDRTGKLVNVPQFPFEQPVPVANAKNFRAEARYGYVWVCLGEPLADVPELAYDNDPAFRSLITDIQTLAAGGGDDPLLLTAPSPGRWLTVNKSPWRDRVPLMYRPGKIVYRSCIAHDGSCTALVSCPRLLSCPCTAHVLPTSCPSTALVSCTAQALPSSLSRAGPSLLVKSSPGRPGQRIVVFVAANDVTQTAVNLVTQMAR